MFLSIPGDTKIYRRANPFPLFGNIKYIPIQNKIMTKFSSKQVIIFICLHVECMAAVASTHNLYLEQKYKNVYA